MTISGRPIYRTNLGIKLDNSHISVWYTPLTSFVMKVPEWTDKLFSFYVTYWRRLLVWRQPKSLMSRRWSPCLCIYWHTMSRIKSSSGISCDQERLFPVTLTSYCWLCCDCTLSCWRKRSQWLTHALIHDGVASRSAYYYILLLINHHVQWLTRWYLILQSCLGALDGTYIKVNVS